MRSGGSLLCWAGLSAAESEFSIVLHQILFVMFCGSEFYIYITLHLFSKQMLLYKVSSSS